MRRPYSTTALRAKIREKLVRGVTDDGSFEDQKLVRIDQKTWDRFFPELNFSSPENSAYEASAATFPEQPEYDWWLKYLDCFSRDFALLLIPPVERLDSAYFSLRSMGSWGESSVDAPSQLWFHIGKNCRAPSGSSTPFGDATLTSSFIIEILSGNIFHRKVSI